MEEIGILKAAGNEVTPEVLQRALNRPLLRKRALHQNQQTTEEVVALLEANVHSLQEQLERHKSLNATLAATTATATATATGPTAGQTATLAQDAERGRLLQHLLSAADVLVETRGIGTQQEAHAVLSALVKSDAKSKTIRVSNSLPIVKYLVKKRLVYFEAVSETLVDIGLW